MGYTKIFLLQGQIQVDSVEMSLRTLRVFILGPKYFTKQDEGTFYISMTWEDSYFLSSYSSAETSPETTHPFTQAP